jgi:hypothetical protein
MSAALKRRWKSIVNVQEISERSKGSKFLILVATKGRSEALTVL